THEPFPKDMVVALEIETIFRGKVHSGCFSGPIGSVMGGLREARHLRRERNGESRILQQWGGSRGERPVGLIEIEDVCHRRGKSIIHVERRQSEHLFDGADKVYGVVRAGDDSALFYVRTGYKRDTAMRVNVIGAVLRIVFNYKDQ